MTNCIREISEISFNFSNWDLSAYIEIIKSIISKNTTLYEQWKDDNQELLNLVECSFDEHTMVELKTNIEMLFASKPKKPKY